MNFTSEDKVIEVKKFFTWLGADGIMRTRVKFNADIVIEDALENTNAVEQFFYGKKFPLIVDTREIKTISKEARDHFSMKNRKSAVSSIAIIINSQISRIIGNFFMGLNKPAVPVKLFSNESEAIKWSKQYL